MPIKISSMGGTPFGTTANRPSSPGVGQTYYNGELGYLEIYTSSGWIAATGANDFNLNLAGPYTSVTFTQSYSAGSYSIISNSSDATIDIYAFASDGSTAGYTSTKSFNATQRFNKMVIIGGTTGDVLSFSYKTTFATTNTTSEITAGPFITSITPSIMANKNDTITITGGNFATDVTVSFTGTGYSLTSAKSIVRSSASQLVVTRPDNFPITSSPYTVTVTNPSSISQPIATSANISLNSITAGVGPIWVTTSPLSVFTKNVAYSTTLSATDADGGSSISYSLISGSLPVGLSLNSSTGVISGTPTSSINTSFTIRATDTGGNYLDRAFTMADFTPTWSTAAGALTSALINTPYSTTLSVIEDGTYSYSILSGSLPTGLSFNTTTGVISGTPTVWSNGTASSFSIRVTDDAGNTADRAFTLYVAQNTITTFTSTTTWNAPAGTSLVDMLIVAGGAGGSGGAGAGGSGGGGAAQYISVPVTGGSSYPIVVGAGGAGGSWYGIASAGSVSSAIGYSKNGGNPGGPADSAATNYLNGGSSGNGNSGGSGNNATHDAGGVGGGGAGAGGNGGAYSGSTGGAGGAPFYSSIKALYYGGGSAGGSYSNSAGSNPGGGAGNSSGPGNIQTSGAANTGGAGGAAASNSSSSGPFATGGSGLVVLKYLG